MNVVRWIRLKVGSVRILRPNGVRLWEFVDRVHRLGRRFPRCAEGGIYFRRGISDDWSPPVGPLSLRGLLSPLELRVFALIGDGCDDNKAARTHRMSLHAILDHRTAVIRKFGVHTAPG